jgi:hypothetical protein
MTDSKSDDVTEAKPVGRPSLYKPEYITQAAKLCDLGATDQELADFFEVHVATLNRWKLEFPEFCASIRAAKENADERVERSLYQMATGYEYTEQQAIKIKLEQYKEEVEVVDVLRHKPAETPAAIFWLKNRRKDTWRDKVEQEHSGTITLNSHEERLSALK